MLYLLALFLYFQHFSFHLKSSVFFVYRQARYVHGEVEQFKAEAAERAHLPQGDDAIKWIVNQIIEVLMYSRFVEEVYADDITLRKKLRVMFRTVLIDDAELHREARSRLRNIRPGTAEWDIKYAQVLDEVRRKRGLA